ncbi:hypothetical protein [Sorangium sp. So ce1078]
MLRSASPSRLTFLSYQLQNFLGSPYSLSNFERPVTSVQFTGSLLA